MSIIKMDMEPTKENLFSTISEDLIGRNEAVWYLAKLCDMQEDSCTIAIDGKWGSGKTFFIKHTQMLIESANLYLNKYSEVEQIQVKEAFSKYLDHGKTLSECLSSQVCVYYDAWANDNDADPILSLVYSIIKETGSSFPFEGDTNIIKIAALIVDFFLRRNSTDIVDFFQKEKPLSTLQGQKDIHDLVTEFLDSLLEEHGNRLIVFIDELDRCKPSFAVQLLERIKHYFNNDRITFVFAINIEELQHTVKSFYGEGFDACRYLDRFFDYRIALPAANLTRYLQKIGLEDNSHYFETMCRKVIYFYSLSLREIVKYYRVAKMASYKPTHSGNYSNYPEDHAKAFAFCLVIPIIIGLSMKDADMYRDFIEGRNGKPLVEIIGNGEGFNKVCSFLLGNTETFEESAPEGYMTVRLSDKLMEAYNALFTEDPNYTYRENAVGRCCFTKQLRTELLKASSMLSSYSEYS